MLEARDLVAVREWGCRDPQALRTLSSMLFETESLLRWRAIEAVGVVAGEISRTDAEPVRRLIRRLLWLMNDESGGLCWHAPEAIAEILHADNSLVREYSAILLSFFHEEPFEVGVRLGVARLAGHYRRQLDLVEPALRSTDQDRTPEISLASLFALKATGLDLNQHTIAELARREVEIQVYNFNAGEMLAVTPGGMTDLSLQKIGYGYP
jgi:hypothetical protein